LTFSKLGQVAFNQTASRVLKDAGIEWTLVLWDADEGKMAFQATTNERDPRAYHIRYNDKGNGATFSAKTFLDHAGIDYSERKAIPIDINPNQELFVEAKVPDSLLKKKSQQDRLLAEKVG